MASARCSHPHISSQHRTLPLLHPLPHPSLSFVHSALFSPPSAPLPPRAHLPLSSAMPTSSDERREPTTTHSPDHPPIDSSLDMPGPSSILHLEHFNLDQPCSPLAQLFYSAVLSCTPDPGRTALHSTTLWMNLGSSQMHLPLRAQANRMDGAIGLVISPQHYDELPSRMRELQALPIAQSSLLSVTRCRAPLASPHVQLLLSHWHVRASGEGESDGEGDGGGDAGGDGDCEGDSDGDGDGHGDGHGDGVEHLRVTCPWGNAFEVFAAASTPTSATSSPFPTASTSSCSASSTSPTISSSPSPDTATVGLAYGRIHVPASAPAGIARYFSHYFHTPTSLQHTADGACAVVQTSDTQRLLFQSHPAAPPTPPYPSWHFCLYLSQYCATFHRLLRDGLVRALDDRSDYVTDWKGAKDSRQFRALEMRGGGEEEGGQVVWGVEQELRSGQHRHYMRQLLNEPQKRPAAMAAELGVDGH